MEESDQIPPENRDPALANRLEVAEVLVAREDQDDERQQNFIARSYIIAFIVTIVYIAVLAGAAILYPTGFNFDSVQWWILTFFALIGLWLSPQNSDTFDQSSSTLGVRGPVLEEPMQTSANIRRLVALIFLPIGLFSSFSATRDVAQTKLANVRNDCQRVALNATVDDTDYSGYSAAFTSCMGEKGYPNQSL